MKFKVWKEEVKSIRFDIPDISQKIKPYAYRKRFNRHSEPVNFIKKPRLSLAPLFILVFLITLTFFSTGNISRDRYLSGNHYLSYFTNSEEISKFLTQNQESSALYLMDYRETSVMNSFKLEEKSPLPDMSSYFPKNLNEYLEEDITVKAEGNYLYTVSPTALNIIDTSGGKMQIVFTKLLANYRHRPGNNYHAELHLTDNYLIVIFTDENDFETVTNVLVFDKTFSLVYEYQVLGNYLESNLIDNKLYLFNQIPLLDYLTKEEKMPFPIIKENSIEKDIKVSNISYIEGFGGESYTIISCLDLNDNISSEDIVLLSYHDWKQIYLTNNSLYLINNHQNTDDNLEYGIYTAMIRYDISNGINYSSSFKFKGNTLNKFACDEYNGYLRVAISVVDYKITKNLLQTKIEPVNLNNKVLVMKESGSRNSKRMKLVSALDISTNEHLQAVRFQETEAYVLTEADKLYQINLNNPSRPKLEALFESTNTKLFFYPLSENTAFTIEANKGKNGYTISLFSLTSEGIKPWKRVHEIKYSDFSFFPVLEAVNNRNAIFTTDIRNKYYLGFSVTNFNRNKGEYLLFEIDPVSETFRTKNLQYSDSYPNRMIAINDQKIIALSHDSLYSYNNNFEEIERIKLPH
jgi:hypothetical protein